MENSAVMPTEGGVLKEVLSTPTLKSGKPDKSHPIVMALLWQDPEIVLSILGSIPPVVNSCVGALTEVGNQVNEKFSPEMIKEFTASLLRDIDTDKLKTCAEAHATLIKNLWEASPELRETLAKAVTDNAPPLISKGINSAAHFVNEVSKSDPRKVSKFVSDVVANIDGDEFRDASHNIVNAVLDQKLHLVSWTWQLLRKRMKRRK